MTETNLVESPNQIASPQTSGAAPRQMSTPNADPGFVVFTAAQHDSLVARGHKPDGDVDLGDGQRAWLFPAAASADYQGDAAEKAAWADISRNRTKDSRFICLSLAVREQYPGPRAGGPGLGPEMNAGERTLADLAEQAERQPLTWLVPSTIVEGGIHIIHGKEESFKTTLVMQLLETLNLGGRFLNWDLLGGLRVAFAELEMTEKIFKQRARSFMKPAKKKANIFVLSAEHRRKILDGKTAEARVRLLLDWVKQNSLDVLAVDSLAKLFPPDANIGSQPTVSDVFNQLQKLGCTAILIAHPRKSSPWQPNVATADNDEIAGSGRFAQDPDIVIQLRRPDKRAPKVVLSWGKNRLDFKPDDLELFFDAADFRLYPRHPFLHLLPASREQMIQEAETRFGWKQRRADDAIAELKELKDSEGSALVEEVMQDKRAVFRLSARVSSKELVQSFAVNSPETRGPTASDGSEQDVQ